MTVTTDYLHSTTKSSTRDGFGRGLAEVAEKYPHVVGLCADLTESTRMNTFAEQFPDRFIQVGVAEQNLAGVAAGLAQVGKKPFCASYAAFHPGNSWGVIRTSICYQNLPVVIVGGHAGLTTGPDGATHQALEDIALMRVLPNMAVVVPCDAEEARKAAWVLAELNSPSYLRTTKHSCLDITVRETEFQIGKAVTLKEGTDITLISCGVTVEQSLLAAHQLESEGMSVRVLNMHTIKPIDSDAILTAARQTHRIITVEDHQVTGGLGSAVAEVLATGLSEELVQFKMLGVQDQFGESGTGEQLLKLHGLDSDSIAQKVKQLFTD